MSDHRQSIYFYLSWLLCLGTILILSHCSGAGAPPVSIQAPVGSLMSVSAPDDSGNVTITGAPSAALAGATVLASNPPAGNIARSGWQDYLIKNAIAQEGSQASAIADSQGAFLLQIQADECDRVGVRQELDGDSSPETIVQVPGSDCAGGGTGAGTGGGTTGGGCAPGVENCNDTCDNDGDGDSDCQDPDCNGDPSCVSCSPNLCENIFGACTTDADCLACQVCSDENGGPVNTCIPAQNCAIDGDCGPLLACDIIATCDTGAGVCR